jgi:[ribosomal protein S5]-alanine N-acetyltransferase
VIPPREFETARLHLRPPTLDDSAAVFAGWVQDPEITRYMEWRPHRDIVETETFLRRCERVWNDGTAFPWLLVRKDTGAVAGMGEIRLGGHKADIGYVLARAHWGLGLMTEAMTPVVDWALSQPSIHRVWATCDVDNATSARVLERLGMQREGVLRRWILHPNISDQPRDSFCYARIK